MPDVSCIVPDMQDTSAQYIALGQRFVTLLEEELSPVEWAEMLRRNALPEYDRACASHDFLDANVQMQDAFIEVVGRAPEGTDLSPEVYADPDLTDADIARLEAEATARHEADTALWNAAWDWAKANYLTDNATSRQLEAEGWPEHTGTNHDDCGACYEATGEGLY